MLPDRLEDRRRADLPLGAERVRALGEGPAVVPALADQGHRFPQVLPDVAGPDLAGGSVDAELPDVPQPVRPHFRAGPGDGDERVVSRDGVRLAALGAVDVDPHHGRVEVGDVLAGLVAVRVAAAVAGGEVEHAVGAEREAAAEVVLPGGPLADERLGRRVAVRHCRPAGLGGHGVPHDPAGVGARDVLQVADVDVAVLGVPRVERHAPEAPPVAAFGVVRVAVPGVEERVGRLYVGGQARVGVDGDRVDLPALAGGEPPFAVGPDGQVDRAVEFQVRVGRGRGERVRRLGRSDDAGRGPPHPRAEPKSL